MFKMKGRILNINIGIKKFLIGALLTLFALSLIPLGTTQKIYSAIINFGNGFVQILLLVFCIIFIYEIANRTV